MKERAWDMEIMLENLKDTGWPATLEWKACPPGAEGKGLDYRKHQVQRAPERHRPDCDRMLVPQEV